MPLHQAGFVLVGCEAEHSRFKMKQKLDDNDGIPPEAQLRRFAGKVLVDVKNAKFA